MSSGTVTAMSDAPQQNSHVLENIGNNGSATTPLQKQQQVESHRASEKYKHTYATHVKSRTSCLSHDSTAPPSYAGFRNLMGMVLVASNLRLMIENFRKYGILVTLSGSSVDSADWKWFMVLYLLTPCHLYIAYMIELLAARYAKEKVARAKRGEDHKTVDRQKKSLFSTWRVIAFSHAFNATFMLVFSTCVVYFGIYNPGLGMLSEIHAVIVWLKVCSYAFTNRDLRHAYANNTSPTNALPTLYKSCPYPQNITVRNISYFWWAPTLIYQPVYPRTEKIRWDFVARRASEAFLLCVVIWLACAQYAVPLLQNSLYDIEQLRYVNILERTLKLSSISLVCWLAGFFAFFQSFLNLLAEVMRFGDREFYSDWWNSSDLRRYWTSWNKPVTHFMKRHVYAPLVGRGVPPILAQLITFTFSGILHELLIGIPTHNLLGVAFAGMMIQLPLIIITDPLSRMKGHNAKIAGNLIFWASFCILGQPIAALMYFFAWQAKYGVDRPAWPVGLGRG